MAVPDHDAAPQGPSPAVSYCSFRHSQQHCAPCHKMIAGDFRQRV